MLGAPAAVLALLVALGLARAAREEDPVAELQRAFARSGRPLGREVTLASLERRLAGSPDAVAYLRALRLARFGHAQERPQLRQRRALRRALGEGLGPVGRIRALWALPPRWRGSRAWSGNGRAGPGRRSRRA